jgi:hypothetical protein
VTKSRSQQIDELLEQSRELLDGMQEDKTAAQECLNEIRAWREQADSQVNQIQQRHNTLEEELYPHLEQLQTDFQETLEEQESKSSKLFDTQNETFSKLTQKLETLRGQYSEATRMADDLLQKIESLLPGATSAGLASAFKERKESFSVPKRTWSGMFVLSIAGLILVAYLDIGGSDPSTVKGNLSDALNYVLVRLPFAAPLIWLAVVATQRSREFSRLEEEWAHKEALSKSFEGYKKELSSLEVENGEAGDQEHYDALRDLVEKVLSALASDPAAVFKETARDRTPADTLKEIRDMLRDLTRRSSE